MHNDLPSMNMVRVTNRNDFLIEDMHDGVPYRFPANETVTIYPEVAAHIFGYPGDDEYRHLYMSKRWGWNDPKIHHERDRHNVPLWKRMAQKIDIRPVSFDMVERDPIAPRPVELGDAAEVPPKSANPASRSDATRTGRSRR